MNRKSHHRYHLRHFANLTSFIFEAKASLRDGALKTGQTVLKSVCQLFYTPPCIPLFFLLSATGHCDLRTVTPAFFSVVVSSLNTSKHPQIAAASADVLAKS